MLDLRELIAALDDEDKRLWAQHRTEMRRSYMTAHNSVLGIGTWSATDDMFLDLIDVKLALLFDKSGRINHSKVIVETTDSAETEADIEAELKVLKDKAAGKPEPSEASKSISSGWGLPQNEEAAK